MKICKKALAAALVLVMVLTACSQAPGAGEPSQSLPEPSSVSASPSSAPEEPEKAQGQIYLYGEQHGVEKILAKENEVWHEYYHGQGMRHLFVELPYYTAQFLNLWMQSDSDEILDALYADWKGSAAHNPYIKGFYQKIKADCPETVFHGTDVGHQYDTTGERYLGWLRENGREDSEEYAIAQTVMDQGVYYYDNSADTYRENKMVENFTLLYDKLEGESVMGIYGAAHTGLGSMDITGTVPCMANQLQKTYGEAVHSEDLTLYAKETEPQRMDTLQVDGREYKAAYFGKEDLTGFRDFAAREFWRLEDAYEDFQAKPSNGDFLPYSNYPMVIETGQVFVIDYTMTDGSVTRSYYRSDGNQWDGRPSTEGFSL